LAFSLALLSGILLALSFPKFGHPAFGWIALAPLLVALAYRPQTFRRSVALGLLTGFVYFAGTLYWFVVTMTLFGGLSTPVATVAAAMGLAYLALYPAMFAVIQSTPDPRDGEVRAAAGARRLGRKRDGANLLATRLPLGPARVQPGYGPSDRRSRASSASTGSPRLSRR
jgi:4-hydroxybenzoate polyprenyltransferase